MADGTEFVVPMRLFANWETDRATANVVQRMFTMSLSRLILDTFRESRSALVVTVKLQGYKRTMRSNDFMVSTKNSAVDVDLNLSFTIQYPHFLKHKENILQVLIQRRKRYKNRQIPGYKTLAVGSINLSEVMQNGSLREVTLMGCVLNKDIPQMKHSCMGKLLLTSCHSQAFEMENELNVQKLKDKELESDEDDYSSSEPQVSDNDNEPLESARSEPKRRLKSRTRERKIAQRKNLKQKLRSLLKKFKVAEDAGGVASNCDEVAPTDQELEEIFEELENLSDSGPEMIMDNLSIVSNPRPGLKPYFTTSREVLPVIADDRDISEDSDEEWSSEPDNPSFPSVNVTKRALADASIDNDSSGYDKANSPIGICASATVASISGHSARPEIGSKPRVSLNDTKYIKSDSAFQKVFNISNWLSEFMKDDPWNFSERIWICSLSQLPVLSLIDKNVHILDCSSYNDCRLLISSFVAKIQKFCNTSSTSPPCTLLCVIGHDQLISHVLRAYVESLQNKTTDWINFLRFSIMVPPWSTVGKVLPFFDGGIHFRDIFERSATEFSLSDLKLIAEKLISHSKGAMHKVPISEAMLQLHGKSGYDEKDTCQTFIPFLSEIRIGPFDDDADNVFVPVRSADDSSVYSPFLAGSPPLSPQNPLKSDTQDLHVEYWIANSNATDFPQGQNVYAASTSSSKRDVLPLKYSIRSTFRTLVISRDPHSSFLTLHFIKEKRKDKVLHKLGMKKGQRNDIDLLSSAQTVSGVSRAICSGKHNITVLIDGCRWKEVRFFQVSMQWQTHVKYFPICVSATESTNY